MHPESNYKSDYWIPFYRLGETHFWWFCLLNKAWKFSSYFNPAYHRLFLNFFAFSLELCMFVNYIHYTSHFITALRSQLLTKNLKHTFPSLVLGETCADMGGAPIVNKAGSSYFCPRRNKFRRGL